MTDPGDHGYHLDGWGEAVLEVEPVVGGADAHANNDIPTEIRLYPAEWGQLLLK
jgi:hypothetical protein